MADDPKDVTPTTTSTASTTKTADAVKAKTEVVEETPLQKFQKKLEAAHEKYHKAHAVLVAAQEEVTKIKAEVDKLLAASAQ